MRSIVREMLDTRRILQTCNAIAMSIAKNDSVNADDIRQQAFLEFLESEDDYQQSIECPEDFCKEFARLAVNAYNRLLYSMRDLHIRDIWWNAEISEKMSSVDSDSEEVSVYSMLDQLPGISKTVCLYLYRGYNQTDIAQALGISQQSVSDKLAIARRELKCIV